MEIYQIVKTLLIGGLMYWLVTPIPLPNPFPTVIRTVVIVFVALYLLGILAGAM